jgi:ATP-dependent 26S proteasome regulatory subunit
MSSLKRDAQMTNWISDEVTVEHMSERSTVFILQTEDKTRIDQLIDTIRSCNITKLFKQKQGYQAMYEYNILRKELRHIGGSRDKEPVTDENNESGMPMPPLQAIDKVLHSLSPEGNDRRRDSEGAIIVVHWLFTKAHADNIADMLASWAHDGTLFKNNSSIFVFTVDETFFSEPLRRLCYTMNIPTGSDEEIRGILQKMITDAPPLKLKMDEALVQAARGLNLHQVQTAAMKGIFTSPERQLITKPFKDMKIQILKSMSLTYYESSLGYNAIGSYGEIKQEMQHVADQLKDPAKSIKYGLGPPRGIILDGPPGVGKTALGLATANALGIPMILLTPADLYFSLVGQSEKQIPLLTRTFQRLSPIIVFMDEADSLFRKRDAVMSTDSGVNRRVMNGLLEALGDPDRAWFFMAATNRLEDMDEAAYRPGRADQVIHIPYPDKQGRKEIFTVQCTVWHHIPVDANLNYDELADVSFLSTGAEIQKWCRLAARTGMLSNSPTITNEHFKAVADQVKVNVEQRWKDWKDKLDLLRTFSNVNVPLLDKSVESLQQEMIAHEDAKTGRQRIDQGATPDFGKAVRI